MIALLLDLANILGGFILAIPLLQQIPRVGDDLAQIDGVLVPFAWIIGIVALVCGGYYFILHATSGPHIFHFEVVAIGVGVALLWGRLTGRSGLPSRPAARGPLTPHRDSGVATSRPHTGVEGAALLLAVFGIIAIIVGIQGIFTPD